MATLSVLLDRHLSTIGIEDVFLEPPAHPILREYADPANAVATPFASSEIVGTLKATPEDFRVREIAKDGWSIPGVAQGDLDRMKVAFLPSDDANDSQIEQNLDQVKQKVRKLDAQPQLPETQAQSTEQDQSINYSEISSLKDQSNEHTKPPPQHNQQFEQDSQNEDNNTNSPASDSAQTIHLDTMKKCLEDEKYDIESTSIIEKITKLHRMASKRNGNFSNDDCSLEAIWIPPIKSDHENETKNIRGDFHRSFKILFPLLKTESVQKSIEGSEAPDIWIKISVDTRFDELKDHLLFPQEDLLSLYRYQKLGVEHFLKIQADNPKRSVRGTDERVHTANDIASDETQVVLRLKNGASKDARRAVHHSITQQCKRLETSTIVPKQTEDEKNGVYAVVARWSRQGTPSRSRKRKSPGLAEKGNAKPYPHVICVLHKRQREHMSVIQDLVAAVRCRQSDIGFAGIKDMQAMTYQFCTFRNMDPRRLYSANNCLKRHQSVRLGRIFRTQRLLNNGDLFGNSFEIVVRNASCLRIETDEKSIVKEVKVACDRAHVLKMADRIKRCGFINFFGEQRIGAAGSEDLAGTRSFDIGRAMLKQDFEKAVDLLICGRAPSGTRVECEKSRNARRIWKETGGDVDATLKALPNGNLMPRERAVLQGLKRYGNKSFLKALKCLQFNMRIFWINAYQSYCWNIVASERIRRHGVAVTVGDLYRCPDPERKGEYEIKVVGSETTGVTIDQIVLPLPGYNMQYPECVADVYKKILEEDGVTMSKDAPVESTAKGSYRPLIVRADDLAVEFIDGSNATAETFKLSFSLPKGCYATMLLREMMLTTVSRPEMETQC